MVKKVGFFYRSVQDDYVINDRGIVIYEPRALTFKEFGNALRYLLDQYGKRKCELIVNDDIRILHDGLEQKLKGSKIIVSKN